MSRRTSFTGERKWENLRPKISSNKILAMVPTQFQGERERERERERDRERDRDRETDRERERETVPFT